MTFICYKNDTDSSGTGPTMGIFTADSMWVYLHPPPMTSFLFGLRSTQIDGMTWLQGRDLEMERQRDRRTDRRSDALASTIPRRRRTLLAGVSHGISIIVGRARLSIQSPERSALIGSWGRKTLRVLSPLHLLVLQWSIGMTRK